MVATFTGSLDKPGNW